MIDGPRQQLIDELVLLHARLRTDGPEGAARGHALLLEWTRALVVMAHGEMDSAETLATLSDPPRGPLRDPHRKCGDYLREDPMYACSPSCPARWAAAMGRLHEPEE